MPGFGGHKADPNQFNDNEIVLLANYVFEQYGRVGTSVAQSDVAMVRQGGPSSPLVWLAKVGVAAAVLVFLLLGSLLVFRALRQRRAA
jgi:fructose 5-dehydrogenase cytochrome subunit